MSNQCGLFLLWTLAGEKESPAGGVTLASTGPGVASNSPGGGGAPGSLPPSSTGRWSPVRGRRASGWTG